jgi:hypothetical protein
MIRFDGAAIEEASSVPGRARTDLVEICVRTGKFAGGYDNVGSIGVGVVNFVFQAIEVSNGMQP